MATFGVIGLLCTGGMVEVDWFVGVIIVAVTFLHILSRAENIYETEALFHQLEQRFRSHNSPKRSF